MIVFDTHVWVWWVSDPKYLSTAARKAADEAKAKPRNGIYLSSISVWEVALLVAKGRLQLTMKVGDWIRRSEALPFLNFVPVDNAVALRSVHLPGSFHADPCDRIIVATAQSLGADLITKDEKIRNYPHVKTVW
jgi:PIN domain nuclease of toxin-antitoxin system